MAVHRMISLNRRIAMPVSLMPEPMRKDGGRMAELNALINSMAARRRRRLRPLKHGKRYTYEIGCRCEFCIKANRQYCRDWQREKKRNKS